MGFLSVTRLFIIFTVLICTIEESNQQGFNCRKVMLRIAKKQVKNIGICARGMKGPKESLLRYHVRMDCVMKCVMNMEGMLDRKMKVTERTLRRFFEKYLPEDFHEIAVMMLEGCLEEHAPMMKDQDTTCKAYGGFISCIQASVGDLCG